MHQYNERYLLIVFHHERLDHQMFIHTERFRSCLSATMFLIFVRTLNEVDLMLP